MTDAREAELIARIDHLVSSSVKAHEVLETRGRPITLVQRATEVMDELKALRKLHPLAFHPDAFSFVVTLPTEDKKAPE